MSMRLLIKANKINAFNPMLVVYFLFMIQATATPSYQELLQQNIQQRQIIEAQAEQIEKLSFELAQLKRMIFGSKSERFIPTDKNQLHHCMIAKCNK